MESDFGLTRCAPWHSSGSPSSTSQSSPSYDHRSPWLPSRWPWRAGTAGDCVDPDYRPSDKETRNTWFRCGVRGSHCRSAVSPSTAVGQLGRGCEESTRETLSLLNQVKPQAASSEVTGTHSNKKMRLICNPIDAAAVPTTRDRPIGVPFHSRNAPTVRAGAASIKASSG